MSVTAAELPRRAMTGTKANSRLRTGWLRHLKAPIKAIIPRTWWDCLSLFAARTYLADGLMTMHIADFLSDERFLSAYKHGEATGSWNGARPLWRVYTACWAAAQASALAGDFVECGVNRGGMSLAIMNYIGFSGTGKQFFLLDTFCGFPKKYQAAAAPAGPYEECYNEVVKTFSEFSNVRIIRGCVPDTLPQIDAEKICYLSLDMNCAEPEIDAMQYLWPRLVPGALVLLDDYTFSEGCRRQKDAFDLLSKGLNFNILSLPTGQGLIIKA